MEAQGAINGKQKTHDSLDHPLSEFQPKDVLQRVISAVGSTPLKASIP